MSIALKSFQFTPLREGRPDFHGCPCRLFCYFNSRPSARGDAGINTPDDITKLFQFTPLREGRLSSMPRYTQPRIFQFTPLREGRLTFERAYSRALSEFQFTPLREGRRAAMADISAIKKISIHAPPRGATKAVPTKQRNRVLFQFTPLREGRRPPPSRLQAAFYFNSRPSARGDSVKLLDSLWFSISIHAPPRGATGEGAEILTTQQFQFTPLREGRQGSPHYRLGTPSFQFTPLCEGRRSKMTNLLRTSAFQFTPLCEGRHGKGVGDGFGVISIHAPLRGATLARIEKRGGAKYFNSRPSARGDPQGTSDRPILDAFQFTPLREGRHNHRRRKRDVHGISIHAPPRGATGCGVRDGRGVRFQFTPLREGRRHRPYHTL